jgi:hypothetical protein
MEPGYDFVPALSGVVALDGRTLKARCFHDWSIRLLSQYLHELEFRWNQRDPVMKRSKKGKLRNEMKSKPVMSMIRSLLAKASCCQIRSSSNGRIFYPASG